MPDPGPKQTEDPSRDPLREVLVPLAEALAEREAEHSEGLAAAWREATHLHARVAAAVGAFHAALAEGGIVHLRILLGEPRLDDKHVRAVEFDLSRGKTAAVVSVRSSGEVTLVGPFRIGSKEGPCETVPWSQAGSLDSALAAFLERFVERALAP